MRSEIILYQPESSVRLEVRMEDETVWSTKKNYIRSKNVMKQLFSHLKNVRNVVNQMSAMSILSLIRYVNCVTKPNIPIKAYADLRIFKLYVLDVGLLSSMCNISPEIIIEGSKYFDEFKGLFTEQYVLQELSQFPELQANYYWTSGAQAEIDFLVVNKSDILPLETKSGFNVHAKSLKVYNEKYHPKYLLRTSLQDFQQKNGLTDIPLYCLFCIKDVLDNLG